ncbi:MAG: PDZ domain-containing protein [Ignavibacteria bacterium]|nr:PDZ domain-containing protein [Ignavibacteria bacterium]
MKITYVLSMSKPYTHYFELKMIFQGIQKDRLLELKLPVWRPGRYLVMDFASGVREFNAFSKNGKLSWEKTDKSTWLINTERSEYVEVTYKIYANEFHLRTKGLDENHGFVNGAAVFMYSEKYRHKPVKLKVIPYRSWHVTTGLKNEQGEQFVFSADNYDHLIDCPLEIGEHTDTDFYVQGKKHTICFYGDADYSVDKLKSDFSKIIEENYKFWGWVPYESYVFIIHCTPNSAGGTEHRNSTVVGVRPVQFRTESGYKNFLRLISHEFFHTWNVKQLKPEGLTPYDYSRENYTKELWIAEGGTSYYDGLILLRAGLDDVGSFYKRIAEAVEDDMKRPGNRIQSLAESSFDAWIKFWRRNPDAYESESDYYKKGSYVCMLLDLEIRHSSKNKHSLDDVFRYMADNFPHDRKGYTNEDFIKTAENYAGKNLKSFFNKYLYGTDFVDWNKYLSYAGLVLKSDDSVIVPVAGLKIKKAGNKVYVDTVLKGSSAEDAGIISGDEIIALNGQSMSYEEMESRIKSLSHGESIRITVWRNNFLYDFTLTLRHKKISGYYVEKIKTPSKLQKKIYESWLGVKW